MRPKHIIILTTTCLLLAAGCASASKSDNAPPGLRQPTASSPTPKRVSYEPPRTFSRTTAVVLPEEARAAVSELSGGDPSTVALHKTLVYVAGPTSLIALDTATGKKLRTALPDHPVLGADSEFQLDDAPSAQPVISGSGDTSLVAQAFLSEVPASGTTPARRLVEVVRMNADTTTPLGTIEIELPAWAQESFTNPKTAVVDSADGLAVVAVRSQYEDDAVSFAIDLTRGTVRWQKNVLATGLSGRSVVAIDQPENSEQQQVLALDLADGSTRWATKQVSYATYAAAAGPHLVHISGRDYGSGDSFARLLDTRTGRTRMTFKNGAAEEGCTYDAVSIVVCSGNSLEKSAAGFDAKNGSFSSTGNPRSSVECERCDQLGNRRSARLPHSARAAANHVTGLVPLRALAQAATASASARLESRPRFPTDTPSSVTASPYKSLQSQECISPLS